MQSVQAGVIKKVCVEIYGRTFSDRTWQRWRNACRVPLEKKVYMPAEWQKLIAFTKLKRQDPFGSVSMAELYAEIKRLQSCQTTVDQIRRINRQVLPSQCYGSELPDVIAQATGRRPSIQTLYKWGRIEGGCKFGTRQSYDSRQINWWVKQARKTANLWSNAA